MGDVVLIRSSYQIQFQVFLKHPVIHWGQVNWVIIVSGNDPFRVWCQVITWTSADLL